MGICYDRLFHLLSERNMTTKELEKKVGYSGKITTRMRRHEFISLESVKESVRY